MLLWEASLKNCIFRLEDGGQQGPDIAEDQYENEEFYREQQPKNNDLRIEEEDEGEGKVLFCKWVT